MDRVLACIERNLAFVRGQIERAAERSGRTSDDITLVAVTKFMPVVAVRSVIQAGCLDLGESRPQDLWERAGSIQAPGVRWHLVGHLQRNKVRRTLPTTHLVHSVDSERLLEAIDAEAAASKLKPRLLLEVNVSGEAAKHGFAAAHVEQLAPRLEKFQHVQVVGLMGMAPLEGGKSAARRAFVALRELRDRLVTSIPPGVSLAELSMGMSGDFTTAIEEGATIVRVGSALFEGIER